MELFQLFSVRVPVEIRGWEEYCEYNNHRINLYIFGLRLASFCQNKIGLWLWHWNLPLPAHYWERDICHEWVLIWQLLFPLYVHINFQLRHSKYFKAFNTHTELDSRILVLVSWRNLVQIRIIHMNIVDTGRQQTCNN